MMLNSEQQIARANEVMKIHFIEVVERSGKPYRATSPEYTDYIYSYQALIKGVAWGEFEHNGEIINWECRSPDRLCNLYYN